MLYVLKFFKITFSQLWVNEVVEFKIFNSWLSLCQSRCPHKFWPKLLFLKGISKAICILLQAWENYVHVRKRKRNVDLKIYEAHEMFVHVTWRKNKLKNCLINIPIFLYFCMLAYRLITDHFIQTFFSQIQIYCPLKYVWFVQEYSVFLIESVKFEMLAIFRFNYRCITIIWVLFAYVKVIRSRLGANQKWCHRKNAKF